MHNNKQLLVKKIICSPKVMEIDQFVTLKLLGNQTQKLLFNIEICTLMQIQNENVSLFALLRRSFKVHVFFFQFLP